jgi:uncharacterized protein (DUF3084 family)
MTPSRRQCAAERHRANTAQQARATNAQQNAIAPPGAVKASRMTAFSTLGNLTAPGAVNPASILLGARCVKD